MESIYAVIFTLILMFPFVLQLHMLILDPKKLCSVFHYYATSPEDTTDRSSSPKLLQYYPKVPIVFDVKSDSKISLTNLRTVSSSPTLVPQISSIEARKKSSKRLLLRVKHSCTFVKTDQVLPVVDITSNYSSYRYKAFETCLRNLYGDNYPPGEVVLNSMQLNLLDSRTNVSRLKKANLFDFIKDSELTLATSAMCRKFEIEYLNVLDHFVTKLADKPSTEERFTETL
ncbi:uncharacterized protein LOC117610142 isoform X1 [Osmia lignaria lignaria]|uniref:uncharacterized protein LOC117610142 isoform X1 n=1 Tax=Osmia lignaria lignaria TaxID=1437193 RepID=UPI00402B28DD